MKCEKCAEQSVLSHEPEHSRNRNCRYRKVASLTLAIAIADVTTRFTSPIKFLGDKLLCGHVPDAFLRCGIGSGHVRLLFTMIPHVLPSPCRLHLLHSYSHLNLHKLVYATYHILHSNSLNSHLRRWKFLMVHD